MREQQVNFCPQIENGHVSHVKNLKKKNEALKRIQDRQSTIHKK